METLMSTRQVSMRDIAKEAGVSVAAVSYALRGKDSPFVSEKQRKHILETCEKLHYSPNIHAKRMFSHRSDTVAVFYPSDLNPANSVAQGYFNMNFAKCLLGMHSSAMQYDIDLILAAVTDKFIKKRRYLSMVRSGQVDGILLWGVATPSSDYVYELLRENVPVAMLETELPDCDCIKVLADDYGGSFRLVERAIAAGHRRIAVVSGPETASTGLNRARGALDALKKNGLEPEAFLKLPGFGHDLGKEVAEAFFSTFPEATCVVLPNDAIAFCFIDELEKRGLKVPRDVSVTGGDGIELGWNTCRLATFVFPSFEIGVTGAELLIKAIRGESKNVSRLIPVKSVDGDTIGKIPVRKNNKTAKQL